MQFRVVQIAQTLAGHHDNIQTGQQLLIEPEGIPDQAFQAVTLDGKLDAFLADHQPQAGMVETVATSEKEYVLAGGFAAG
ncbi:hypothetical protein A9179_22280 [Pseudomonas alcaligenes]|uniref:Uncharacterized protein n=1 Tax=Aquipseudomonas alcaligenes TaxID=43263 RepID=A0ABR7S742_AQUAC|nr:hypothetical protein [Pseudomonas alcaligenes]